jgi:tetratricopeptide (TPR) repeat protein
MLADKVVAKEALNVAKNAQKGTEELKPSAASAFVMASAYKFDKGSFEEALKAANQALDLDPRNLVAMVAKARALKRLGRVQEALDITNEALKLPDVATPNENLGVLLYNKACYTLLLKPEAVAQGL